MLLLILLASIVLRNTRADLDGDSSMKFYEVDCQGYCSSSVVITASFYQVKSITQCLLICENLPECSAFSYNPGPNMYCAAYNTSCCGTIEHRKGVYINDLKEVIFRRTTKSREAGLENPYSWYTYAVDCQGYCGLDYLRFPEFDKYYKMEFGLNLDRCSGRCVNYDPMYPCAAFSWSEKYNECRIYNSSCSFTKGHYRRADMREMIFKLGV